MILLSGVEYKTLLFLLSFSLLFMITKIYRHTQDSSASGTNGRVTKSQHLEHVTISITSINPAPPLHHKSIDKHRTPVTLSQNPATCHNFQVTYDNSYLTCVNKVTPDVNCLVFSTIWASKITSLHVTWL